MTLQDAIEQLEDMKALLDGSAGVLQGNDTLLSWFRGQSGKLYIVLPKDWAESYNSAKTY